MRIVSVTVCLLLLALSAFGQTANGTITGTITDPAGAVVPNAMVVAKSIETGVPYPTQSTSTGNYTIINLPVGTYELTVTASGFKTYDRQPIIVQAAQVVPVNVPLEVGATGETVTVTAESTLLQTETGDLVHNVTLQQLDELPILGIGAANAGPAGIRNPYNSVQFLPGVRYVVENTMVVNGAPNNSAAYRIEGQDTTNHTVTFAVEENQPSADAIQEVAVQTSNYAAEFGAAGGGLFNITMKSGTNEYHGSAYDYFVNEFLNAGDPFSYQNPAGGGGKVTPRNRRNDFGGTLGGPIDIPHVYNGHNKTFFFFNYEEYLETTALNGGPNSFTETLPTAAYRQGNFSAIDPLSPNFNPRTGVPTNALPSKDAAGNPIYSGVIYDPNTRSVLNGVGYATPFPGNIIPSNRFNPMALAVQNLIPAPCNANFTVNGCGSNTSNRGTTIPSLKLDQIVGSKGKLSFYWSDTGTDSQYAYPLGNADGLPPEITAARGTFIHSQTERLNYDYTLTPTLLLHLGAGYQQIRFFDDPPVRNFQCASIGLQGCQANNYFPTFTAMTASADPGAGGMEQMGNAQLHTHTWTERPTYNANITSIKGNHTYKFGGEVWFQGNITQPPSGATLTFGTNATALPFNPLQGLGNGFIGFPYASFLLGDLGGLNGPTPQAASQNAPTDTRMGKSQWGLFAQDSWKITRKLTLDYGLRWDYGTLPVEQYGRSANFSPTTLNPAVGINGAPIFQQTCNCSFGGNYPFAFGPRIGLAYQITPKTVLRAGWGLLYDFSQDLPVSTSAAQINAASVSSPNAFVPVNAPGALPQPIWPNFSPGQTPLPGQTTAFNGLGLIDGNFTRPGRQNQWSIGIQQELATNLVVEASYVGDRGAWWASGNGGSIEQNLGYLNQVSPATFAAYGLHPYTNPADNLLLNDPISSPAVIARVGNISPYPGFPTGTSLLNALRPFPQFSNLAVTGAPTGDTWYDSLQTKVTKRLSHGLSVNSSFTWSKSLMAVREDLFNPASSVKTYQPTDQPFLFNANILYVTPAATFLNRNWVNQLTKDWQIGAFVQYGSGILLTPPTAVNTVNSLINNSTGATSYELRVPGVPLYLKNPNCGCVNPYTDQILNPKAWANPAPGTFGGSAYYGDFRGPWDPMENFNFGRNFRIKERMNLEIRAEFTNIFNRTFLGNPNAGAIGFAPSSNPQAGIGRNAQGQITSGFGIINAVAAAGTAGPPLAANLSLPRQGTIIARFTF